MFLSHRGLTGYVAVDNCGFKWSAPIRIDWEKARGTSCEPVGLAGGFKDGWPENGNKKTHQVSSYWASSIKENCSFSIVEIHVCFAFLLSSITKLKRQRTSKEKLQSNFNQSQNLRELKVCSYFLKNKEFNELAVFVCRDRYRSRLTVMTGGSRVPSSRAVTEERVPGLRTISLMLAIVRKTSARQIRLLIKL